MAEINCSIDYKVEYELRRDINSKAGEILKLEYINAKHCREIESLTKRINTILATTEDSAETVRGDQTDHITECKDLFEYIKVMILELSHTRGIPMDSNNIDIEYIKSAVRYTMPGLFSMYALLGEDDKHKIELADGILMRFGIRTMAKYEELIERDDINIMLMDRRT